jgi:phosphatidylglycerophosphate synthase
MTFTLLDVRSRTYKARDAWWTVFLVDPLAGRLVVTTANRTSVTPNQITWGAFVLGLGSAWCFLRAEWPWLIAGAVLYHVSFVLDCMDGKIARLKGTGTVLGG